MTYLRYRSVYGLITMMMSSNGNISALLALCARNSLVTGEFPIQRPVRQSFDISLDMHLNKRLSKQSWGWWFETPSHSLWCHHIDILHTSSFQASFGERFARIILGMGLANEMRCCIIMPPLIGSAHTQNNPCFCEYFAEKYPMCWVLADLYVRITVPACPTPIVDPGLILGLHPAKERRRYEVAPFLIGCAQTWNQPCWPPLIFIWSQTHCVHY